MPLSRLVVDECPLPSEATRQLQTVLAGLSAPQLAWVSGYLYAVVNTIEPAVEAGDDKKPPVTILYGSQTGNAKAIAGALLEQAVEGGLQARLVSMADYRERDIAAEERLIIVVSTHGEGEPPEDAVRLYRFLHSSRVPALESLQYAILGLGDSSYELFCQAARDFDERLSALGARAVVGRVDCDVDFDVDARDWRDEVVGAFAALARDREAVVVPISAANTARVIRQGTDRTNPYPATVLEKRQITGERAVADVRHIELSLDAGALTYQPGDALGVRFRNDPGLVERTINAAGLDGDAPVQLPGHEACTLREALSEQLELTRLHPSVVTRWADTTADQAIRDLLADRQQLNRYLHGRQVPDLLGEHGWRGDAGELVSLLQPMQPRLYSIASSPQACPGEVHLTVSLVSYTACGRQQLGGASGFLVERIGEGDSLDVYVAENAAFRLPADNAVPIIMIAAGTGIAPFRAFMQQRDVEAASGANWLLFGNRNLREDFLYQLEWLRYRQQGLLDRLDVAFSRDTNDGAYVQQRVIEQGDTLYRWLEQGAHLYVCGSTALGKSVSQALLDIASQHGGMSAEDAQAYLDALREQGRYQRDLY